MSTASRFVRSLLAAASLSLLALATGCSGGGPADAGDAGTDARPRPDRLNLNCTSAAGEEGAADCNARLGLMSSGATFFVGPRSACAPDPNNPACMPLCPLTDMNPMNCTFDMATGGGCAYDRTEGYAVVVEAGGRRSLVGVGRGDACPGMGTQRREWGRVAFEDLQAGAECARSMPPGGFGPVRFGTCDTPMAACGDPATSPSDMCRTLNFMAMQPYEANVCTRMCNGDMDCGGRGRCLMGICFNACGGTCGLSCQDGFGCNMGVCLPNPPQ